MGQQKKMAAATERGFRGKKKVLAATVRGPRQKQKVHAAMGQRKKMANKKRPVATGRGFRQEGKHLRPWANKKRWLRRLPGKQERASGHGEGFRQQKNTCGHVPIRKRRLRPLTTNTASIITAILATSTFRLKCSSWFKSCDWIVQWR